MPTPSDHDTAITLHDIKVRFRLDLQNAYTLKEYVLNIIKRQRQYRDLWALNGVTATIKKGESVAIVGRNGSGKSTLLKVIAGVFQPTTGESSIQGSVSALIELGAGFNGELTGRENVFLNGAIMGLSKRDMMARYDGIVEFAELGDFMDTPVKNYSSGMYARLGFSLATAVDGDILLIDEVLGVGDEAFQKKSMERIEKQLSDGKTVVFVSHDAHAVERLCQRAIVLNKGDVIADGDTKTALERYREVLAAG